MQLKTVSRKFLVLAIGIFSAFLVRAQEATTELTVSAAASLTNAFTEIAQNYEVKHSNTKVILNFASSGSLLQQIANGAPVDIFASADQLTMNKAKKQDLIVANSETDFISNTLVLIAPITSNLKLDNLTDLLQTEIKHIAIGNPAHTPAGTYIKAQLERIELWDKLEHKLINVQNVRQALDYVAKGETEAGFVFASDAMRMLDKVKIAFRIYVNEPIYYPIAITKTSTQQDLAQDFIDYVMSNEGQEILVKYGFEIFF